MQEKWKSLWKQMCQRDRQSNKFLFSTSQGKGREGAWKNGEENLNFTHVATELAGCDRNGVLLHILNFALF